jgi:hypothetical protein
MTFDNLVGAWQARQDSRQPHTSKINSLRIPRAIKSDGMINFRTPRHSSKTIDVYFQQFTNSLAPQKSASSPSRSTKSELFASKIDVFRRRTIAQPSEQVTDSPRAPAHR